MSLHTQDVVVSGIKLDCTYEVDDDQIYLVSVRCGGLDISDLIQPGSWQWEDIEVALIKTVEREARMAEEDRKLDRHVDREAYYGGLREERRLGLAP